MRSFFSSSSKCCPPCYSTGDGCNGTFVASGGSGGLMRPKIIGLVGSICNQTEFGTSCISLQDAAYKGSWIAIQRCSTGANPVWASWSARFDNVEISYTAHCPCGYTGDPVTYTVDAGTFTDYWTPAEANKAAWEFAKATAESLLDCT